MVMGRIARSFAILFAATPAPLAAQSAVASAQGDVAVTIYNNDRALIQDVRQIAFGAGQFRTELPDVSAQIIPQTVVFSAADTTIQEQNFDFSLLSPDALMRAAVGQVITIVRTNPATGVETNERATVLAVNGGVVLRIGERIEVLRDDGLPVRAVFDAIPSGMRARPTLSITVDSARAGTRQASLRYLTRGMGWSADYVAQFDDAAGRLDMQGWVTLTNNSGTTFTNAATTLVAGSPRLLNDNDRYRQNAYNQTVVRTGTETGNRERLGDFYLYPIAGRTTIAASQTKQVSFLDAHGALAQRGYTFGVTGFESQAEAQSADSVIRFSAASNGGLGAALPAGTVRFYMRDRTGSPQFIGERAIGHTPMGSELELAVGQAFDVKVQATLVGRDRLTAQEWTSGSAIIVRAGEPNVTYTTMQLANRPYWRTRMRYTLTNARSEPVTVDLTQYGLDWWYGATNILYEPEAGVTNQQGQRRWSITVPANGRREFEVTYQTRY
jgi:hypothetical protein